MEYRTLGKTGLRVSEVGFGAEWMPGTDEALVRKVTNLAADAGINIVDCRMADSAVRKNLGSAVRECRGHWIVQGHIGSTWQGGQYVRTRDLAQVKTAWEFLLDCFGGHIELGMIHYVDSLAESESIMSGPFIEFVRGEKAEGRIDHIGLSTHNPDVALAACDYDEIGMIMFSLNPAYDMLPPSEDINTMFAETYSEELSNIDPRRQELHRICEQRNVGITVMKPFAGGRLLDAEQSPFGAGMTPVQCISYCLSRPAVVSVLAGYRSVQELEESLAYASASVEERDFASVLAQTPSHSYFGQCIYCGHCQPCAVGIDIATVNKFGDLARAQEEIPESAAGHYEVLEAHAGDCIGCGACEPNCPFDVPIAERMAETAELFGC